MNLQIAIFLYFCWLIQQYKRIWKQTVLPWTTELFKTEVKKKTQGFNLTVKFSHSRL